MRTLRHRLCVWRAQRYARRNPLYYPEHPSPPEPHPSSQDDVVLLPPSENVERSDAEGRDLIDLKVRQRLGQPFAVGSERHPTDQRGAIGVASREDVEPFESTVPVNGGHDPRRDRIEVLEPSATRGATPGPNVTAAELWVFIQDHAEMVEGRLVCRTSLWGYLGDRGIDDLSTRRQVRTRLVKELESEGKVMRRKPRSVYLDILEP